MNILYKIKIISNSDNNPLFIQNNYQIFFIFFSISLNLLLLIIFSRILISSLDMGYFDSCFFLLYMPNLLSFFFGLSFSLGVFSSFIGAGKVGSSSTKLLIYLRSFLGFFALSIIVDND